MGLDEKLVYGSILVLGVFFVVVIFYFYFKELADRKKERLAYKELMWLQFAEREPNEKYLESGKIISYKKAKRKGYVPKGIIESNSGVRRSSTGDTTIIPAHLYVDSNSGGGFFGGGDCGGGGGGDCGGGD